MRIKECLSVRKDNFLKFIKEKLSILFYIFFGIYSTVAIYINPSVRKHGEWKYLDSFISRDHWICVLSVYTIPFMFAILFFCDTCVRLHKKLAAWQIKRKLGLKHFCSCVQSFIKICYAHDAVHIVFGFIGLVSLDIYNYYSESAEAPFICIVYTIIFLSYICKPVWSCTAEYKETFSKAFREKLARRFQRLDEHILAIGYGKFGNTVIKNFIENYFSLDTIFTHEEEIDEIRKKNSNQLKLICKRMLNESCEEILFCTNLLIIEKDERYFNCVHEHPVLGKIGVLIMTQYTENIWEPRFSHKDVGKKIYIPVVIGNILDFAVQNSAKFDNNKMVLSMVPGSEISFQIVNLISNKQKNKKGLISVSDMHAEFCLAPGTHNTEIDFLNGHQVSGWEVGDTAYANYSKRQTIYSAFRAAEFEKPLTIDNLCKAIDADKYNVSLQAQNNTIRWLNELLMVPNFYDIWHNKKTQIKFTENITDLANKTTSCRKKKFSDLSNNEQNTIITLNRLLLEKTYPRKTPKRNKEPKILILGNGKQLHYVLEKLWLEMKMDSKYLKENCLIITEDAYINKAIVFIKNNNNSNSWRYWHHKMGHVIGVKFRKEEDVINEYLIPCIKASPARPTILEEIITGKPKENPQGEPWNVINYNKLKKPDVIIIVSNTGEETIHIFHNINTIIKRNGLKGINAPTIIVETNASTEDSINQCMERYADNTGNALKEDYGNTLKENSGDKSAEYRNTYPIPFLGKPWPVNYSENILDSFTFADTIVRGYVESMSSEFGAVLRACIRNDHPGALAKLFFLLAGFDARNTFVQNDPNALLPSFHNTSTLSHKSAHFCFFTNADLLKNVSNLICNNDDIHAAFVSSTKDEIKKSIIGEDSSLIPIAGNKCEGICPRLTICPISSMIQNVNADVNSNSKKAKKISFWEKTMEEFCANNKKEDRNTSLARLSGCCYGNDKPGSLALLLHKLLLRNVNDLIATKKPFNIRSIVSLECYNPQFTLLKINGIMHQTNEWIDEEEFKKIFLDCLQGIVISPVKAKDDWYNYAKTLRDTTNKWLKSLTADVNDSNENNIDKFTLILIHDDLKQNLLIISKVYKNLLLRELLHVHTEQIVQHSETYDKEEKIKNIDQYFRHFDNNKAVALLKQGIASSVNVKTFLDDYNRNIVTNDDKLLEKTITEKLDSKMKSKITPCSVPIRKCPFKSKAIYLLTHGKYAED